MNESVSRKFYFSKEIQKGYLATVYNYKPRNENILARKGEVFAVLRLKSDPGFDLITAGGILLDYFHETYFEIQESSTLLALEKTVISSSKHLAKLIDNDNQVGKSGIEMDLLAMSIVDNVAYFVNAGSSSLKILRQEELVDIKSALKDPSGEGMVEVASMELMPDDRLLISTDAVSKLLKKDQTEKILKKFDIDDFPKKEKNSYEHALMIVGYKLGEEQEEPPTAIVNPDEDDKTLGELIASEKEEVLVENKFVDEPVVTQEVENSDITVEDSKVDEKLEVEEEIGEEMEMQESVEVTEELPDEVVAEDDRKPLAIKEEKTYKVLLTKLTNKLKLLPKRIKSSMDKTQPELVPSNTKPKQKMIIIILVLFLLSGALYLGVRQAIKNNTEKVQTEEAQVSLEVLTQKVETLETLVAEIKLNDSTEKRQQGINEVALVRAEIDKVKDFEQVKSEVEEFASRVQSAEDYFNRIVAVSEDNKLVDVASFFPDAVLSDLAFSSTKIFLSDSGLGKIYSINYDGTDLQEIVSDLKNPTSITVDTQGRVIFLDDSSENRIGIFDPETKATKRLAGTSTARTGEVASLEFAEISGGRVYLINITDKKVMYIEKTGDNYGLPASRFELAELATGKDIYIIDNKIYVLAEINQGLYRFLNGQDDSPELIGLPEGEDMNKSTGMFVDGTNIYFTDPENNRVAVFDKGVQTAKFKGQYKSRDAEMFGELLDVISVVAQGKIYTIDKSVLYELDLSGLNEL
jgi:DNA-binding beta-propeller fold protein YncE